jgi:hypothetical protein
MARSTVKPQQIWVRRKDDNILTLRIRWNIHTEEVEDMDGEKHTEYEYEECEIKHTLPDTVNTVSEFKDYMKEHRQELVNAAKVVRVEDKPKLWEIKKAQEARQVTQEALSLQEIRESMWEIQEE